MKIFCPVCNAAYDIDEDLIKNKARKLKCSSCGEIFTAGNLVLNTEESSVPENVENPFDELSKAMQEDNASVVDSLANENKKEDVKETADVENVVDDNVALEDANEDNSVAVENNEEKDDEEKSSSEVDLENIFERLSEHTAGLIEREKKLPFYEKLWLQLKNILGFHFKIKWNYVFMALAIFVCVSLYNNRYQVVRDFPFFNDIYKFFGIKARIAGEGLEFQNISWNILENENGTRLEIKGFVYNLTDRNVELPTIHVEILDKTTALLQSQNRDIDEHEVAPSAKVPLYLAIDNPAPTAKYVYLTFVDKN